MQNEIMGTASRRPKNLRFAVMLTLLLPGAGQFYLGQIVFGLAYAVSFLACFVGMLVIFFRAYSRYLAISSSGDILGTNQLEEIARVFNIPALVSLSSLSVVIFLIALGHLVWSWWRRKTSAAQEQLAVPPLPRDAGS